MINLRTYAKYFVYFDPRTAARLALAKLKLKKAKSGDLPRRPSSMVLKFASTLRTM